jgi:hypothetical protein
VTYDDELKKMQQEGSESFRLQKLVDAANGAVDKRVELLQGIINSVEGKIDGQSADKIKEKTEELNSVFGNSLKALEDDISKEVDAAWKAMQSKNKELRNYKYETRFKVGSAVFVMGANALSMIATGGANALAVLSIINTAAGLYSMYLRESMNVFEQVEGLSAMMEDLDHTVYDDLGGFKDAAKNAANDAVPLLGRFITSTKTAETELKTVKMKFVGLDKQADEASKKINESLARVKKLESGGIDGKTFKQITDLEANIDTMLEGVAETQKQASEYRGDLDEWQDALDKWNARNSFKSRLKKVTGGSKAAAALAGVANGIVKTVAAIKILA